MKNDPEVSNSLINNRSETHYKLFKQAPERSSSLDFI